MKRKKTRVCKGKCGEEKAIRFFRLNRKGSRMTVCKRCEPLPMKKCGGKCGEEKLLKDFNTYDNGRHHAKCKACEKQEKKEKYETIKRRQESQELSPEAMKLLASREQMREALLEGRADVHERDYEI